MKRRYNVTDEEDQPSSAHANIERLMVNPAIPEHVRFLCAIALAVTGDTNAMEWVIELLPRQSAEYLGIWCWHIGPFSKSMAIRGLATIKDKALSHKDMCAIISPLSVGLNYRLKLSFSCSGVLSDEHRHPAAQDFVGWVSDVIDHIDFEPDVKLRLLGRAKQMGCDVDEAEALALLKTTYDTFVERDEDENDSDLSTAIHNGFFPFSAFIAKTDMGFVWKVAGRPSGYFCNYAINLIADKGDVDAIPRLLDLYATSSDKWKRSTLLSALERLSSRYGNRIIREGDNLKEAPYD